MPATVSKNSTFSGGGKGGVTTLPSLNALHAFVSVARAGSVAAAAQALYVTPSAVSRQLRLLERDLGCELLERDGRGVRLTTAGEHLRQGLDPAFAQLAETVGRMRRATDLGTVVIRVPPTFAAAWLVPRLEHFRRRAPDTNVVVHDIFTAASPRGSVLSIEWGRFEGDPNAVKLADVEFFPVCSPGLARGASLAGVTLLHHERLPEGWGWMDWHTFLDAAGIHGIGPTAGPRFSSTLIFAAARHGLGAAISDTTVAHDDLAAGRLVRPIAASVPSDDSYWLLIPAQLRARPGVMAFCAWLREECGACFGAAGNDGRREGRS